MIQKRR